MNYTIAPRAPKAHFYSGSSSLYHRVSAGVAQKYWPSIFTQRYISNTSPAHMSFIPGSTVPREGFDSSVSMSFPGVFWL